MTAMDSGINIWYFKYVTKEWIKNTEAYKGQMRDCIQILSSVLLKMPRNKLGLSKSLPTLNLMDSYSYCHWLPQESLPAP